jgi:hypothetical protein
MVASLLLLTGKKRGLEKSHERWSYFTMVQPAIVEEKKTVSELRNGKGLVVGHESSDISKCFLTGAPRAHSHHARG